MEAGRRRQSGKRVDIDSPSLAVQAVTSLAEIGHGENLRQMGLGALKMQVNSRPPVTAKMGKLSFHGYLEEPSLIHFLLP